VLIEHKMFPFLGSLDTRSLQDNDDSNEDDSLQLTICPAVPLDENIESDVSVRGSSGVFWLDGNVIYENALRFSNSVGEVPKKRGKQMNTSAWFRDKRLRRTVMEETRLVHWTNAFPSHDRMGKIETLRMHKEGILFAMRRDEFEKSKRSRTGIRKNSKAQMEEHFEKQFSTLERLTNENTAPFAQVGNMLSTFDVVWTSTFPFWEYGKGAKRLTIIVPPGTDVIIDPNGHSQKYPCMTVEGEVAVHNDVILMPSTFLYTGDDENGPILRVVS